MIGIFSCIQDESGNEMPLFIDDQKKGKNDRSGLDVPKRGKTGKLHLTEKKRKYPV